MKKSLIYQYIRNLKNVANAEKAALNERFRKENIPSGVIVNSNRRNVLCRL